MQNVTWKIGYVFREAKLHRIAARHQHALDDYFGDKEALFVPETVFDNAERGPQRDGVKRN
jgi:hypothetical protein